MDAIVYCSASGHAKWYAERLSEIINIPLFTLKQAKRKLKKGSSIYFISWIYENKLMSFEKLGRYKICASIGVGIMPKSIENTENIKRESAIYGPFFYARGGITKKKMKLRRRFNLKMITDDLSFKLLDKRANSAQIEMLDAILKCKNFCDEKNLEEFLLWIDKNTSSSKVIV